MSQKEKDDLYLAIGYSENEKILDMSDFDKSYVGLKLSVELHKVSVFFVLKVVRKQGQEVCKKLYLSCCFFIRKSIKYLGFR